MTRRTALGILLAAALALLVACSVNPATGKRQLAFVGESDERQMGLQYDKQIVAQMGLVDDPALQDYVQRLGAKLAARSERPGLDWTFRVIDDPVVNAFALPGGYIYVTRGILAHFNSEAELASVLGHEIGHVTARHSVNQMSKQQLAQLGLGVGMIMAPRRAQQFGGLAQNLAGVMFLKFGRDDERQADDLGLRYLLRGGYDPRPMSEVFRTLEAVSEAAGGGRVPAWLSTHPDPGNRAAAIDAAIAAQGQDWSGRPVERDAYLERLEGLVFGEDPRQGYFDGERFFHPEMRFELTFPAGWQTQNQRAAVVGLQPEKDAVVVLSLAAEPSVGEALSAFMAQQGIEDRGGWQGGSSGFPAQGSRFHVADSGGGTGIDGIVAFLQDGERVFRLLGYGDAGDWPRHLPAVERFLRSYRRLDDPARLNVSPDRVHIVEVGRVSNLDRMVSVFGASVSAEVLGLINRIERDAAVQPGRYKIVRKR